MLQDKELMFSIDQEVTTTCDSDYYIPIDVVTNAEGKQLTINSVVSTTFEGLTTLEVSLVATANDGSTGGKVIQASGAVDLADLVAGKRIPLQVKIPFRDPDTEYKNLILVYTVAGTGTAGKITSGIEYRPQTNI